MGWAQHLPDGVSLSLQTNTTLELGVALPVSDDGMMPLRCPETAEHHFKLVVVEGSDPTGDGDTIHCPYCGYAANIWDFMPQQADRMRAAAAAAAEQYFHESVTSMFNDILGSMPRRLSGGMINVEFSHSPGDPPPRRMLPPFDIEATRRTMCCSKCGEIVAVYGLAFYCPECGQMAPAQQFTNLIKVQRGRLASLDAMDSSTRLTLDEAGIRRTSRTTSTQKLSESTRRPTLLYFSVWTKQTSSTSAT